MKRWSGFLCACVLSCALLGGCGGDGGTNYEALAVAFEDCSQESLAHLINVIYALGGIPDYIESEGTSPFPGFDVDASPLPAPPDNSWQFSVLFDTNGNAVPDTVVFGTATFSEDPSDGLEPGATVQISFQVEDANSLVGNGVVDHGTLTGGGNIVATTGVVPEEVAITGTASFDDGQCAADLTFDVADPLVLVFTDGIVEQLAADLGVFQLFGPIQAFLETLGHDFDADLLIEEAGQTVFVTGLIDGTVEVDTEFELVPPEEILSNLFNCAFNTFEWFGFFADVYQDVADVAAGAPAPDGLVVTVVNANTVNYAVDLAAYAPGTFVLGTLTGQATATFPALSGIAPSDISVTWVLDDATFTGGEVTNGQNAPGRPLHFHLVAGQIVSFSGAGTLSTTVPPPPLAGIIQPLDCVVTFDIPENRPVDADGEDFGLLLLTVTVEGNVLNLAVDFDEGEPLLTVNGIPLPFFPF